MPETIENVGKIEKPANVPQIDFSQYPATPTITESTPAQTPSPTTSGSGSTSTVMKLNDPSYIFGVGINNGHGSAKPEWMLGPTLEALGFDDEIVEILKNKTIANLNSIGFVKSSEKRNFVFVHENGEMEVNEIDVMKLSQTDGDTLIINGGISNNGNENP